MKDVKINPERVRKRMTAMGLSQPELGRKVGMAQTSIASILAGKSQRPKKLREIAATLETSQEYLLGLTDAVGPPTNNLASGLTAPISRRTIPLLSFISAGKMGALVDPYEVGGGEDVVPVHDAERLGPRTFALRVDGDSMVANPSGPDSFREGDIIIVDPDAPLRAGCFVVAKTPDHEEATFKKYRERGVDSNGIKQFELLPLNQDHAPIPTNEAETVIVGRVVEHHKKGL